jgi:Heparan-alpha-glucosaminide N-acetyltransferase, catalytic
VAAASRRLTGVDAARGIALLAMMAVHVLPPADPDGSTSAAYLLVSGRAAALFAVLAGVGLGLATGPVGVHGRERMAASGGLVVRALAIGAVGLWLGRFADSGVAVILPYYAVLFVLALPLLGLRSGALSAVAVVAAVLVPVLSYGVRGSLPDADRANPTLADLADPPGLLSELLLTGYYPALAWTAYLAAGLAAGRLGLGSARLAGGLLAAYDARRPTRDADFAARSLANQTPVITRVVQDIAHHDGRRPPLRCRLYARRPPRDDDLYSGVRIHPDCRLATARTRLEVGVNVGDPISPAPQQVNVPRC